MYETRSGRTRCEGRLGRGETATAAAFSDAAAATPADGSATILLSPAAASFDQFASFVARGEAFCAIAHRLAGSANRGGAHA